jgi:hypothetical protein
MDNSIFLLHEINLTKYRLGKVIPLKVSEIIKYGDDNLRDLLLPFAYKVFDETNEPMLFECLLFDSELSMKMVNFLKIFYRTDYVEIPNSKDRIFIFNNNIKDIILDSPEKLENFEDEIIIIDKNNFQKLSEVICTSFFIFKPKEKEKQVIQVQKGNEAILEEFLRLQERARQEEQKRIKENEKNLHQIITIIASQCLWDYKRVFNMTYYQLWNSYISGIQKDQYKEYIQYKVSPKFEVKDSQKHWMDVVGKY